MVSAFKYLKSAAGEYAHKVMENRRLVRDDIPKLGDLLMHTQAFRWKSEYFDRTAGADPERAAQVVESIFYDTRARREVKRAVDSLGGVDSAKFWDVYLRRSVNSVLGFSSEYLSVLQLAHSALPETGSIVDWTCGTGNLACVLQSASPERMVSAVDSNPRAIAATRRMVRGFLPQGGLYNLKQGTPFEPGFSLKPTDGAILQNALFLLESDSSKVQVLQAVGEHLRENGTLLLIEPKPTLQKQSVLRAWVQRLVDSSLHNLSPANEFDIAVFSEVQRRLLLDAPAFSTTAQLVDIAREAGFEVTLVRDVLYGHFSALVLRKLAVVKKRGTEPVIRYHDEPYPTDPA